MKKLFFFLCSFVIIAGTGFTQTPSYGTVTVNVTGNRTKQIAVDSKVYPVSNNTVSEAQAVVINNLDNGTHTLELTRSNQYNNRTTTTKSSFTLREGYDLTINVNNNGSISQAETRINNWRANSNTGITTAAYNKLYANTKKKTSSTARSTFLEKEFTTTNKKFTAKQTSSLIQLVNSESLRFKLAKLSYPKVSDKQNFSLVSSLLKSTANKTALNSYIVSLPPEINNDPVNTGTVYTPMTNAKFQVIYKEVLGETSSSNRNYYLGNFFTKDFNYYTSNQARQLIQLVSTDAERFQLAKTAYRGVTDRANYGEVIQLVINSSSQSELRTYVASYDINHNNTGIAMSTVDFNKLYQTISYQNSYSTRYNSLTTAFTTTGNYFTVAQAKQLIPLVIDENNRLMLAKSAYKLLVDPANYTQFNDFLTLQSSRNELSNYVSGNTYPGNTGTGTAMNDVDYNKLYKSVSDAWSAATRFNLEAAAFQNTNNYFTTYQVRQLLVLINSETDKLSLAKNAYDNITDQYNFSQLYELFPTTTSKNDLAKFVSDMQLGGGVGTVIKIPMTDIDYNQLYRSVSDAWSTSTRFNLAATAFQNPNNYFTTYQVRQLLVLINSENDKLSLAKNAYDNVTDQYNFSQLYELFPTTTSKNDLAKFVSDMQLGGSVGTVIKTPMTESEFNSIARDVQFTFGLGAKMSSLTGIFNKETNYFTVQQAKQLIQMVSAEYNRLELAKLSYNNITDPANFTQLYDIFTSQTSKDELNAYVGSNAYINR